ncbi:hypothetical protein NFI96_022458, partial [Prochilodus magdalenae]
FFIFTGTHSLDYYLTTVTPNISIPEFTAVGYVDGLEAGYYNSDVRKVILTADWIKNDNDTEHWNIMSAVARDNENVFKFWVTYIMRLFNQTEGIHTGQWTTGCGLDDDGTKRGYGQFGYDGEDFISLDLNTLTWTAANDVAVIIKQVLDQTSTATHAKIFLETVCIERLQKYVDYGNETLNGKVRPEVSLFQKDSSSPVVCHATGFFPKPVMISWQKNGEDLDEDVELRETLPNLDDTFQRRSILTVSPEELKENHYTCIVQHSSLEKAIVLQVKPRGKSSVGVLIGSIIGAAVLVILVVVGVYVWVKKSSYSAQRSHPDRESNPSLPHVVVVVLWRVVVLSAELHQPQLFIFVVPTVSHSLRYISTAVTSGTPFPQYTVVGLVDGEPVMYYDSKIMQMTPMTEWISQGMEEDFWKAESEVFKGEEEWSLFNMATTTKRHNHTEGIHTWQWAYGCELHDNGTSTGYSDFAYDGQDYISLDLETGIFTASQKSFLLNWSRGQGIHCKEYLETQCVDELKKFVGFGRYTPERKVPPEVSLFQKDSSSPVVCHATGFFPKAVTISWQKNGDDLYEDVDLRETLPNQDDTFQRRSILTVSPEELDRNEYTCVVQHGGLEKEIRLQVSDHLTGGGSVDVTVGACVAVLLLLPGLVGVLIWRKKQSAEKEKVYKNPLTLRFQLSLHWDPEQRTCYSYQNCKVILSVEVENPMKTETAMNPPSRTDSGQVSDLLLEVVLEMSFPSTIQTLHPSESYFPFKTKLISELLNVALEDLVQPPHIIDPENTVGHSEEEPLDALVSSIEIQKIGELLDVQREEDLPESVQPLGVEKKDLPEVDPDNKTTPSNKDHHNSPTSADRGGAGEVMEEEGIKEDLPEHKPEQKKKKTRRGTRGKGRKIFYKKDPEA